ncbi:hypothetical protein [Vibrio algivorus]|uniref:P-type conjugative transfer protein TrbJ n=1 Tax=Vibrio algivorus TaxID=1667024 RepID=A0A557PGZ1_9VIBR|nr:hypothetical protein [Vibrio algivorus]TVO39926.1 hypothetical protein FOF44_00210 [Vibrio algivorus]
MKTLKRTAVISSLLFSLFAHPVLATGFPVLDAANFLQNVEGYLNDLAMYTDSLDNTIHNIETAENTLRQYQKLTQQYNLLMRQAQRLQTSMSQHDWDALWHEAFTIMKNKPFQGLDLRTNTTGLYGSEHIVKNVEKQYGAQLNKAQMTALANETLGELPEDYDRSYERSNLAIYQAGQVASFEQRSAEMRKQIQTIDGDRQNLGDASELQTLQVIAAQNQILLSQIADLSELQKTQLELSNSAEFERAAKDQQQKQAQLEQIQYLNTHPIEIDETPLMP